MKRPFVSTFALGGPGAQKRCCLLTATTLLVASLLACSGEDLGAGGAAANPPGADGGVSGGTNNANGDGPGDNQGGNNGDGNNGFVPEEEMAFDFQAPRSSRNFVFVANTSLDSVAKVAADTLEITSIEAGDRPTLVRTHQESNTAVVLNEGSDEVTVIRAGDTEDDVRNLRIPEGMNQIALAPRGDYALTWFDFERASGDDALEAPTAPPFQDVALVDLEEGAERVFNLTVGFQVVGVSFDEVGEKAFVVTRTGLSQVDLSAVDRDLALPPIPLADVGIDDDLDREVAITGDGAYAVVRSSGLDGLNVVRLDNGLQTFIDLAAPPTDLDLVAGGGRAVAVVRQTSEVAVVELPDSLDDPDAITTIDLGDEPAGLAELTPDADRALVYTAIEERKAITVVDLGAGSYVTSPLRKGVRSVAIAPSGNVAVIFHSKLPGSPIVGEPQDDFIAKSWAYSVFDVGTGYAKLQTVATEPGEFVFSEETGKLYVLLNEPASEVRQVEIIDLATFRTETVRVGSPPENVGLIPNEGRPKIYVSQEHPVGRMTFIDELGGNIKTVTGYQLNSLIE